MEETNMSSGILGVIWLFYVIALLVLYHKVFEVHYFDLGHGILKEIVTACFLALLLTGITMKWWYIAVIIIVIVGLSCIGKVEDPGAKKMVAGIFLVIAIVIAIMGINVNKNVDSDTEIQDSAYVVEHVEIQG